jgi:hypothetical protein
MAGTPSQIAAMLNSLYSYACYIKPEEREVFIRHSIRFNRAVFDVEKVHTTVADEMLDGITRRLLEQVEQNAL